MKQQPISQNHQPSDYSTAEKVYHSLVIEDGGRLCKDIPESACNDQPQHFLIHIFSLTASKLADGFVDPKLILSWMLSQLGTASGVIGLLVPVREAGALLPQMVIAEWVRSRQQRKWVWALGAIIQGIAALGMMLAVLLLTPNMAGLVVFALLVLLAVARSFCSVSYKDVLGKTLSKSTRGTATGTANSIAAAGVIIIALLLSFEFVNLTITNLLWLIACAGLLWIIAGFNFLRLREEKGSTESGKNGVSDFSQRIQLAFADKQFTLFVSVRGLLIATSLAPPFMIMLAQELQLVTSQASLDPSRIVANGGQLGFLLLASALASATSSFFWGRLADKSSRQVLRLASFVGALALGSLSLLALFYATALSWILTLPILLFILMVAYQGVRLGRSTHLVDMADADTRANYTAVSNTAIGILLLLGSLFGWLAQVLGLTVVIGLFAVMCLVAGILASRLEEVQS